MLSFNNVVAFVCGYAVVIAVGLPIAVEKVAATVHMLDKATAQQCVNHDWPTSAHYVHIDWCKTNGYKTN